MAEIFKSFNETFGLIRKGLVFITGWTGLPDLIGGVMDGLNPALQESIAKATELGNKMRENAAALRSELAIREAMPTGNTFTDRIERVKGDSRIRLNQFDRETDRLRGEGRANNENFDVDAFNEERSAAKDLLFKDQLDAVNKIIAEENKLIAKLERQNELKAALLGIDRKIAQARTDEDKELEFRLEAEKQKASIISKAMETASKASSEETKILGLKQAEHEINKVNFDLEQKVAEFRREKEKEAK